MPLTLQDLFDNAWNAFVVEKRPRALSGNGGCDYLSPEGHRCAIGVSMPDEVAAERASCFCTGLLSADSTHSSNPGACHRTRGWARENPVVTSAEARCLQNIHDSYKGDNWSVDCKELLEAYAKKHGLKIPTAAE